MAKVRIDKAISQLGIASRSQVRSMISKGRIAVNGILPKSINDKCDPDTDIITVDGEAIEYKQYHYLMMNKPAGVVSATEDAKDKTVVSLLEGRYSKMDLFPVGRLDKDSEGFLILTNDGKFAHKVISPSKNVYKRYYIQVEGRIGEEDKMAVEKGILLKDGTKCRPGKLEIIKSGEKSEAYMMISEGKYHQVKRMMAALGKPVLYLKRVSIGFVQLDSSLTPGQYREMTKEEIDALEK